MALTIRKKPTSISMPDFDLEGLIKESVSTIIVNRLSLRNNKMIKYVEYFPTYKTCKETNDKIVSSIFLKLKYSSEYTRIDIREVEVSGASIVEFVDYLHEKGAREILAPEKILEII